MNWWRHPGPPRMSEIGPVRLAIVVLLFALFLSTILCQKELISGLNFDGENSPSESVSLYALNRLRTGQPLYLDYFQAPHVVTPYMPLFYRVTELIAQTGKNWADMVVAARCSVYVFWIAVGLVIVGLARQLNCGWLAALLAAALWGAGGVAQGWANSVRPDAAVLFFSLAALWIYQRGHSVKNLAASTGLLIVAALYKQTVVAPLAVILLEEIIARRLLRATVAALAFGAFMAAVVVVEQIMTQGRFVLNVFMSFGQTWSLMWLFFGTSFVMGAAAFSGAFVACVATPRQPVANFLKR